MDKYKVIVSGNAAKGYKFSFDKHFFERYWLWLVVLVASAPPIALLLRGVVWGNDSFAFWAVSCGFNQYSSMLSSPNWFVWLIQNLISCNIWVLALIVFVFYFLALLGWYFVGKNFLKVGAWRFPIYLGALTPLFFIEAMRFENDFFSWSLMSIALGLFCLFLSNRNTLKGNIVLFLCVLAIVFSLNLWFPSILWLLLVVCLVEIDLKFSNLVIIGLIIAGCYLQLNYLLASFNFNPMTWVAEEIPLIGLVFVLHILHFWKRIPQKIQILGVFLLLLGALKSKYIFLCVPFLLIPLIQKQVSIGLWVRDNRLPVLYFCGILLIGLTLASVSLFPTQSDVKEASELIKLSKDSNIPIYNDWGDGWFLASLGYDTKYKMSNPDPDWNTIKRPFLAWSLKDLNCFRVGKKTQYCD